MLPKEGDRFARRYTIGPVIGRGAMGVVFEANHTTLDQRVAIKVLRAEATDERATKRFLREATLASRLQSPHVVKVLDVDRTDDDVPYIVMERLEGRDLAAEVEARSSVSHRDAVDWMIPVCDAMREAHAVGIVHRDLKLSNVFLCSDGRIKVLDFGVAALGPGEGESPTITSVAGTTRYMAPEQLLGEAPDPRSDIWAVGVMLYRLVAGRFPYEAPTAAAQMLAIMEGCPAIASLVPAIAPGLARTIHAALGSTLEERCPSMEVLFSELSAHRSGGHGPPRALDKSRVATSPPEAKPKRSRLVAAVSVLLASAVVFLIGRALLGNHAASPSRVDPVKTPEASPVVETVTPIAAVSTSLGIVEDASDARFSLPPSVTPTKNARPLPPTRRPTDDGFPTHL